MKRRRVIKGLLAGGAVLAVPGAMLLRAKPTRDPAATPAAPIASSGEVVAPPQPVAKPAPTRVHNDGPWWLLGPLKAGAPVAFGWRIQALGAMRKGAMVAVLRRGSDRADVHICRRKGAAKGIGYSKHFDLILMNGHKGDGPTNEQLGRIVKSMGWVVEEAEAANPTRVYSLIGAMTHAERVDRYGPEGLA